MPAGPRLARRTALAAAAGLVALSGCDDGSDGSDGGRSEPGGAASTPPDPDLALVDGVVAGLVRAQRVATDAGAADLAALHAAHLEALGESRTSPTAPPPTAANDAGVDLRRHEQRLQSALVGAAVAARSGALAALLASMSAAQAQVLAQWPQRAVAR